MQGTHRFTRARIACLLLLGLSGLSAAPVGAADLLVDSVISQVRSVTLFREHSESRWQFGESRSGLSLGGRDLGASWRVDFRYIEPWGDLRWGDRHTAGVRGEPSRLAGRVAFTERRMKLAFSGNWFDGSAGARIEWQQTRSGVADIIARVKAAPLKTIEIELTRARINPAPAYTELYYAYDNPSGGRDREGGRLFWEAPTWSTTFAVCVCPIGDLQVKSRHRESSFTPTTPVYGDDPSGYYSVLVDGVGLESSLEATYRRDSTWTFHSRVERGRLDARLRAFDGGAQFAYFGIVEGTARQLSIRIRRGKFSVGLRDGYVEGQVKGVVEAWPFADGLLRFLGERRHIVADGRVDWRWAVVDATVIDRRRWTLAAGTDYARFTPDLQYRTWRPVALGFGVDDLQAGSLDLIRADLVQFRVGSIVRFHTWALSATITQWIPIDIKKRSDSKTGYGNGDGSSSGSSSSRSLWGGFTASVSISTRP